ncbi:MAG: LemA family protein [Phycisphaerales bacterium]
MHGLTNHPAFEGLDPGALWAITAVGWVVALLLLWAWWAGVRFCRLLKDLPTVPLRGIFVGLVETTGLVNCPTPARAGISGTECTYHAWSVAEHWRRTQTYTDSKGRTQTRTVSGSDTVASGGDARDFYLQDQTGRIPVAVAGADWRPRVSVCQTVGRSHPLYWSKAEGVVVSGSTGQRTFTESLVAQEDNVYLVGSACISQEGSALVLQRDRQEDDMLLISTGNEAAVRGSRMAWAVTSLVFGYAFAMGGCILLAGLFPSVHPLWPMAGFGSAAYTLLAVALWATIMRNGVVRVRTRWQRAVSLVDVELNRRSDLVPNLVAVVQGYAVHERSVQESLATLRAGAATGKVFTALAEAYPELKADAAFLKLQQELAATEDRIALARTFELESRKAFLERLRTFPEGVIARLTGVAAPPPELGGPVER